MVSEVWLLVCVKLFVIPDRPVVQPAADFHHFTINVSGYMFVGSGVSTNKYGRVC